ncbi:hypothetical protein LTR49_022519 [Elasticomyces elasticus]|nr:hypothetical protein LTR49_022519 [Elasticomyces elasticus]
MDAPQGLPRYRERIIAACASAPSIGGIEYGNKVLALDEDTVVKVGTGVTQEEARNQLFAYETFYGSFHIPEVLDFFEHSSSGIRIGYLVMERVRGKSLAEISMQDSGESMLDQVVLAIVRMRKETFTRPGPIGGGRGSGFPWGDETLESFHLDVTAGEIVISHGDLQRRNMIRRPDGSLCIVDWATAGAYPSYREIAAIMYGRDSDPEYFDGLLTKLKAKMAIGEEEHAKQLLQVQYASLRVCSTAAIRSSSKVFECSFCWRCCMRMTPSSTTSYTHLL